MELILTNQDSVKSKVLRNVVEFASGREVNTSTLIVGIKNEDFLLALNAIHELVDEGLIREKIQMIHHYGEIPSTTRLVWYTNARSTYRPTLKAVS